MLPPHAPNTVWPRRRGQFKKTVQGRGGGFLRVLRLGLQPLLGTAIQGGLCYHPQNLQWSGQQVPPLRGCVGIAREVKGGGSRHPIPSDRQT